MSRPAPPVALSIAGSDPSGGAGVQADLKTFSALGVYGCAVITALTAQNTLGVTGVHLVPAAFVSQQLQTLTSDVRIDAVKIGMLATAEVADAVADFVRGFTGELVVLDPVMMATSGDRLLADDAVEAVRRLLPLVALVTPNLAEAALLLDRDVATDVEGMHEQAEALVRAGARRVLLKGGHLQGATLSTDVLAGQDGAQEFSAAWLMTSNTHGTGCTLSSAVAALWPQRANVVDAIRDAKKYLSVAIAAADRLDIGHGHGPVHHFHRLWDR